MPTTATYDSVLDALGERVIRATNYGAMARCPLPGHRNDDRSPGLNITNISDDRPPLVYCHGAHGACYFDLLDLLGFAHSDPDADYETDRMEEVARYTYTDEYGEPLHQARRLMNMETKAKGFTQYRWEDGWKSGLEDVRIVPYELPALNTAIAEEETILFVEGEKDVGTAHAYGFAATSISGGSKAWGKVDYRGYFKDADVVIMADRDAVGISFSRDVAKDLLPVARQVRLMVPPEEVGDKGDLTDWLAITKPSEILEAMDDLDPFNPALDRIDPSLTVDSAVGRDCTISTTDFTVEMYYETLDLRFKFYNFTYRQGRTEARLDIEIGMHGRVIWNRDVGLTSSSTRANIKRDLNRIHDTARSKKLPVGPADSWDAYIEHAFGTAVEFNSSPAQWETLDIIDLAEVMERPWMLEPIFPGEKGEEGATVLVADGDTGKSFLAGAVQLSIATGKRTIGGILPGTQGKVLYLDWESSKKKHNKRIARLASAAKIEQAEAFVNIRYSRQHVPIINIIGELREQVRQEGIVAVVIDSLRGASKGSLVSDETAEGFFNAVNSLGVPALVIHHVNRTEGSYYGSAFIRNFARCVWECESAVYEYQNHDDHTAKKILNWRCDKDNDGDMKGMPWSMSIQWENPDIHIAEVSPRRGKLIAESKELEEPLTDIIHDKMIVKEGWWTLASVTASIYPESKDVKGDTKRVSNALANLISAKRVKRKGDRGNAAYKAL